MPMLDGAPTTVIERCLKQIHLRLEQVTLGLRHEKGGRQTDFEPTLLGFKPLPGQRLAGPRRFDTL